MKSEGQRSLWVGRFSLVLLLLGLEACHGFIPRLLEPTMTRIHSWRFMALGSRDAKSTSSQNWYEAVFGRASSRSAWWASAPSPTPRAPVRSSSLLFLHGKQRPRDDDGDEEEFFDFKSYEEALIHNQRRTDVRIFLTQRSLQSFIYLLLSCRDPHTVKWLEKTYDFANLESYHGTGALNLTRFDTWDALLLDLVQRPNEVVVVAARRRGRGHGGWSSDNPNLEAKRFVEFEIDIEPASLVSRLVSVRQQIAQEWVADLDTLMAVNELILESYHATQNQQRQEETQKRRQEMADMELQAQEDDFLLDDDAEEEEEDGDLEEEDDNNNPISVEDLTSPYSGMSADGDDKGFHQQHPFERPRRGRQAYESMANVYLNNKMMEHETLTGRPSSPQRKGSFDLLSLLATQEAVHVVLRHYMEQGETRKVSLDWLRQFYRDRIESHFDGDGPYGRSDDFLQDLLLSPPSAISASSGQNVLELVDPLRIAEDIIMARSSVAAEWKEIMQKVVPSDHMQMQKSILAVRMNGPLQALAHQEQEKQPEYATRSNNTEASSSSSSSTRIIGEFE